MMNIILDKVTENLDSWEVQDGFAQREGEVYTAVIQMMVGYFKTGIYHRGFGIWEMDHHGKSIPELIDITKALDIEVTSANEDPKAYLDGVITEEGYRSL